MERVLSVPLPACHVRSLGDRLLTLCRDIVSLLVKPLFGLFCRLGWKNRRFGGRRVHDLAKNEDLGFLVRLEVAGARASVVHPARFRSKSLVHIYSCFLYVYNCRATGQVGSDVDDGILVASFCWYQFPF